MYHHDPLLSKKITKNYNLEIDFRRGLCQSGLSSIPYNKEMSNQTVCTW